MPPLARNRALLRDIIQWDVSSWKSALVFWESCLGDVSGARVLDVGARDGGISLYWALRGCEVVCSDLRGPSDAARELHQRHGVANRVSYAEIDATRMALPDGKFDIVCFKSVLGGIGGACGFEGQQASVNEMHRVLKPGGRLVFAENMEASRLHRFLRTRFVRWGARWKYLQVEELQDLLRPFRDARLEFHGFWSALGRREWQRTWLHTIDRVIQPLIPNRQRYIVLGCARK